MSASDSTPLFVVIGAGWVGLPLAQAVHARRSEPVPADQLRKEFQSVRVVACTLSEDSATRMGEENDFDAFACDVADETSVQRLRDRLNGSIDTVVLCASTGGGELDTYRRVYLQGATNVINILKPKRFVYTSSTSVFGAVDGRECDDDAERVEPGNTKAGIIVQAENLVIEYGGQ